ncbi:MAG: MFS transporter [Micropepsaceae bacterium]
MSERLSLKTKAIYGSGTIAFGVKDQGFAILLMLFYNQVVGLRADLVGAAIMIAMIVDAVIDPLLGQYSDDFRSRWGRRHPFMYAAIVPVAVSYFFLWNPPAWSNEALFAYLVVTAILVRISISLYEIPSTALLAEFSNDYDERTKLVAWRYFFGVLGGLVMMILTFNVFFAPTPAYQAGQLNPDGYWIYALVAAGVMALAMLVSALGTHRRIASIRLPPVERRATIGETLRHMGAVLFHPTYLSVILLSLFASMSSGLNASLGIYFTTFFWELTASQIADLTSSALIGILLAFAVALPLSSRLGKKKAAAILLSIALIVGTAPLLSRLAGIAPANGDAALLPMLMGMLIVFTMATIGASILAVSMIADITEQIRLSTGKRAEGLLFSVATMISKAVSGMGVFVSGMLLTTVAFPAGALPGQVPQETLDSLATIYIALTVGLSLVAIVCLSFYPITREGHADALRRLGNGDA